jgi:hypothetical protein
VDAEPAPARTPQETEALHFSNHEMREVRFPFHPIATNPAIFTSLDFKLHAQQNLKAAIGINEFVLRPPRYHAPAGKQVRKPAYISPANQLPRAFGSSKDRPHHRGIPA